MSILLLVLEGLDCANCASKIEGKVSKLEGVSEAIFNLSNQEMKIKYNSLEKTDLISTVEKIVTSLEPHVNVKEKAEGTKRVNKESDQDTMFSIIRFVIGILFYILAIAVDSDTIKLLLFVISYLIFGWDVLVSAIRNIIRGEVFDENFLMSIATLGAFALKEYSEAVAVMIFYQIGEFFQRLAVGKSRKSIASLIDIKAEFANVIHNDEIKEVVPEEVKIGEIILVKPGEKVPLDGIIIEGNSQIDVSSIMGEAVPRVVSVGDEIQNGTINLLGLIKIKVTKEYKDSTVVKIMELVENAGSRKAPTEKFITKFSKIYTPLVVFSALALILINTLVFNISFSQSLNRSLIFLVISCPCALVISVPLSFFSGIGAASKKGILIKGTNFLYQLTKINTVVFDKTGTLTEGVFNVSQIYTEKEVTEEELLNKAYLVEKNSNHPIAKSIVNYYINKNFNKSNHETERYEEIGGLGISALYKNKSLLVGNSKLMEKNKIKSRDFEGFGTVIHVSYNNKYLGYLVISDTIKKDSELAVKKLKQLGINQIVMLTGDRKESAEKVAQTLSIDKVYSELLPYEKMDKLEEIYKEQNRKVIFAGDGINDAPVLTRADIGIAMGGIGSDAAVETADIVLMTDEPSKISEAIVIAKNTFTIVKQNIIFALLVKFVILILGAVGYASMWLAVFADVGVTLLVILNAMRKK